MKGPVLQNHSHRISMILGNSRIMERSFGEGLVLMVYQRPEALTNTHCNDHLQVKMFGQMGVLCDTPQCPRQQWICDGEVGEMDKQMLLLFFLFFFFLGAGSYTGGRWTRKDWEMSRIMVHYVKFPRNQ